MTASGPFAMGPTLAGSSTRRSAPRSNFAPPAPVSRTSTSFGDNPSSNYSDPEEGVEIIDMEDVHQLDWMAPDSIKNEHQKSQKTVKKEEQSAF